MPAYRIHDVPQETDYIETPGFSTYDLDGQLVGTQVGKNDQNLFAKEATS